ncbi:NACHT domain-containing protein [Planctomycetota bacterium]
MIKKKIISSRAAAEALAKQQLIPVREFLNQEPVHTNLLSGMVEEKGEGDELTLLEVLLKSKKPISAKNIGMLKATVSKAAKELNKYLTNKFSKSIDPLYSRRIVICISRKEGRGGLFTGYHFKCYNKKKEKDLDGPATEKLFENLWKDLIEVKLRKKLEENALSSLAEKLKGRDDYQPLSMEIGFIKTKLQQNDIDEPTEFEEPQSYDHNRVWKSFNIDSLLESESTYILSVDAGGGKTTFLRHLQTKVLQKKKTHLIPIFLDASKIEKWNPEDTREFAKKLAKRFKLKIHEDKVINFLLKAFEKDIILLVDGLDQIKGGGGKYQELIEDTILKLVDNNVVIASRPSAAINMEDNKKFAFLRLKQFDTIAQEKYFGEHYKRARELFINAQYLVAIPMLAYMVRMLIEEKEDKDIRTRSELYEKFIGYIFSKYKHGKARLDPDSRTQIRQSLRRISYDALAEEEPHIQKIPLKFCYDKGRLPDDCTGRKGEFLTKSGLVNLIVEWSGKGDKDFLFFTHQSFQEYLAAEWVVQKPDRIHCVLKKIWNPNLRQVICFLAGLKGEQFIEQIYPSRGEDTCIHSRLFLATECCKQFAFPLDIESRLFRELKLYTKQEPFIHSATYSIAELNIPEAKKFLLNIVANASKSQFEKSRCEASTFMSLEAMTPTLSLEEINKLINLLEKSPTGSYQQNKIQGILEEAALRDCFSDKECSKLIDLALRHKQNYKSFVSIICHLRPNRILTIVNRALPLLDSVEYDVNQRAFYLLSELGLYHKLNEHAVRKIVGWLKVPDSSKQRTILKLLPAFRSYENIILEFARLIESVFDQNDSMFIDELIKEHANEGMGSAFLYSCPVLITVLLKAMKKKPLTHASILRKLLERPDLKEELKCRILVGLVNLTKDLSITKRCQVIEQFAPTLVKLLESLNKKIKGAAGYTLCRYMSELSSELRDRIIEAALCGHYHIPTTCSTKKLSSKHIRAAINCLENPNSITRENAFRILKQLPKEKLFTCKSKLLHLAKSKKNETTKSAILLLAELRGRITPKQLYDFIPSIEHRNMGIRAAIFECMVKHKSRLSQTHIEFLLALMEEGDDVTQHYVDELFVYLPGKLPIGQIHPMLLRISARLFYLEHHINPVLKKRLSYDQISQIRSSRMFKKPQYLSSLRQQIQDAFRLSDKKEKQEVYKFLQVRATLGDHNSDNRYCKFIEKATPILSYQQKCKLLKSCMTKPMNIFLYDVGKSVPIDLLYDHKDQLMELSKNGEDSIRWPSLDLLGAILFYLDSADAQKIAELLKDKDIHIRQTAYQFLDLLESFGTLIPKL